MSPEAARDAALNAEYFFHDWTFWHWLGTLAVIPGIYLLDMYLRWKGQ